MKRTNGVPAHLAPPMPSDEASRGCHAHGPTLSVAERWRTALGRTLLATSAAALATASLACSQGLPRCVPPQPPPPEIKAEYVLVSFSVGGEYAKAPADEVKATDTYDQGRGTYKTAAIRLPDSCLNETAGKVSGMAAQSQTILQTQCGPWLGEIEKALVQANLKVMSWDALWKLEREKGISTYSAGAQLGADIIFVFNSLEAGDIRAGSSVAGTFKYFASDEAGAPLAPLPLDDVTRSQFQSFARGVMQSRVGADQVTALSAIIDVTAVLPATGQSVWFFRRAQTFPISDTKGMNFLFGRYPGAQWAPVAPKVPVVAAPVTMPTYSAEDTVSSSVGAGADPYQSQRLELIRSGADAFVAAFRGGTAAP
ncbi:MAG: hypothetical protein AMXMBFR64_09120 [Myxococcales bacterium]